jgi:hypothetical protein
VERFIVFQRELEELGAFVEMLPFDENTTTTSNTTSPDSTNNSTTITTTTNPDSQPPAPSTDVDPEDRKNYKPSFLKILSFMQSAVCGKEPKKKKKEGVKAASGGGSGSGVAASDLVEDEDEEPVDVGM